MPKQNVQKDSQSMVYLYESSSSSLDLIWGIIYVGKAAMINTIKVTH